MAKDAGSTKHAVAKITDSVSSTAGILGHTLGRASRPGMEGRPGWADALVASQPAIAGGRAQGAHSDSGAQRRYHAGVGHTRAPWLWQSADRHSH